MDFPDLKSFIISFLFIGFGLFLKATNNENYFAIKKWWKTLVVIGSIKLFFEIVLFIME